MPTFIKSIKDNKKLYKKTTFCLKISLKLMDVWRYPIPLIDEEISLNSSLKYKGYNSKLRTYYVTFNKVFVCVK